MTSQAASKSSAQHVSWTSGDVTEASLPFIYDDDETDDGYSYDDEETLDTYYTGMTSAGIQTSPEYYNIGLCGGEAASVSAMSKESRGGRSLSSAPAEISKSEFGQDPVLQWMDCVVGEERLRALEEEYEKLYGLLSHCWPPMMGKPVAEPSPKTEVCS